MMLRRRCLRWCYDDVICDNITTTLFKIDITTTLFTTMLQWRCLRRCCDDVVYDDVVCDDVACDNVVCDDVVCDDCKENNITTLKWITN
jgi:hypothetical protein